MSLRLSQYLAHSGGSGRLFKVPSAADSFSVEERRKQGRVYIDRFEARVRSLLQEKGLADYVHFAEREGKMMQGAGGVRTSPCEERR